MFQLSNRTFNQIVCGFGAAAPLVSFAVVYYVVPLLLSTEISHTASIKDFSVSSMLPCCAMPNASHPLFNDGRRKNKSGSVAAFAAANVFKVGDKPRAPSDRRASLILLIWCWESSILAIEFLSIASFSCEDREEVPQDDVHRVYHFQERDQHRDKRQDLRRTSDSGARLGREYIIIAAAVSWTALKHPHIPTHHDSGTGMLEMV